MKFVYGPADLQKAPGCWLLANGLGGYQSAGAAFGVERCDQGLLVAAVKAPNHRVTLLHAMAEKLTVGQQSFWLSSQQFADGTPPQQGEQYLDSFVWDGLPCWQYRAGGVSVERRCALQQGKNTGAILYRLHNHSGQAAELELTPYFLMLDKGQAHRKPAALQYQNGCVQLGERRLWLRTSGVLAEAAVEPRRFAYPRDEVDGRTADSYAMGCCRVFCRVEAGKTALLEVSFGDSPELPDGAKLVEGEQERIANMRQAMPWKHPLTRQLAEAAQAFLVRRDSTDGMSIIAGYPFFGDWGRDTMIALPGCCLATGQTEAAKSMLRTFLAYEKNGLVPNLFPEGEAEPMYNTVDAALLLINDIWLYYRQTGDRDFVKEAWPMMKRIIHFYRSGTDHHIGMDTDGLIFAGGGLDQVTWMDVCVEGVLPTPRHGKPVEINAYWYSALRVMEALAAVVGEKGQDYGVLAGQTADSFCQKFWNGPKGCLLDVISGTAADAQIRCNQIWVLTMPFTMLTAQQEKQVLETVYRELYTPLGLRTLSPKDPEFHPVYGGPQKQRDMAYHQGTVWPFPLGAFYMAWLKVYGKESVARLWQMLEPLEVALREGCVGQLPEIYDGLHPACSQGCFAQAWSVGELLRVCALLEALEQ